MIVCPFSALTRYAAVLPGVEEAMALIAGLKTYETATYPISNGRVMVSSGTTMPTENATFEAHRQYLDIQYLVKGHEVVGWAPLDTLTPVSPFDTDKDIGFYTGKCDFFPISQGDCYAAFPEDGHMPTRYLDRPNDYCKIVVKLKV